MCCDPTVPTPCIIIYCNVIIYYSLYTQGLVAVPWSSLGKECHLPCPYFCCTVRRGRSTPGLPKGACGEGLLGLGLRLRACPGISLPTHPLMLAATPPPSQPRPMPAVFLSGCLTPTLFCSACSTYCCRGALSNFCGGYAYPACAIPAGELQACTGCHWVCAGYPPWTAPAAKVRPLWT